MRILAVGDIHGDLDSIARAVAWSRPDALVCVGDWGDDGEVARADLAAIVGHLPAATVIGNHDPGWLGDVVDATGTPILLPPGTVRDLGGVRVAGIGGIWAKSHRQPYYVTDEDVASQAEAIRAAGPVDLLLTHGCPIGLADLTPSGHRGGQRCFLRANQTIAPRVHLCGHLHRAQERTLADGRRVLNVGPTPEGAVVLLDRDDARLTARPARVGDDPDGTKP